MTTIVTRAGKGSPLTWVEADANFTNLNTAKLETISGDTTPSLGGNLDTLSRTITSSTGNVLIPDMVSLNGIQVNTSAGLSADTVGKLVWDTASGGLTYNLVGNNVTLPIGQREVQYVYNGTGSTLTKGQVVYINGSQGTVLTVTLASAASEATSSKTIGIVSETITNGSQGYITVHGITDKVDTSLYTAGTSLWLSTTYGAITNVRPTAPNHAVFLGWVVRSHAVTGSIFVSIQNGYELDELHDVNLSSSTANDLLKFDGTVWTNTAVKTVNSTTLLGSGNISVQDVLVSGTNIKTVNGSSLLGAGNIVVSSGTGLGSLTAFKADGSQDDLPVNATTTLNQITINQELLYNKDALIAIDTTGSYGWRDIISDINVKGSGVNNPTWSLIRNGLYGYVFSPNTMNECWVNFHINHDYALGTPIFLHVHWVNPGTNTGTVRFVFEVSIAKGHQQEIFPVTALYGVEQACSGQYIHHVAEIATGITSASLEPDAIVMVRIYRDAAHANDTCTDAIAILTSDIHYQANRFATKNKAPAFNV